MTQPFVHESVRERLVVDARVRYVPVDNRKLTAKIGSYAADYKATPQEAFTNAENMIGIIIHSEWDNERPYRVQMDEWFTFGGKDFLIISVAACDLALVEEED